MTCSITSHRQTKSLHFTLDIYMVYHYTTLPKYSDILKGMPLALYLYVMCKAIILVLNFETENTCFLRIISRLREYLKS